MPRYYFHIFHHRADLDDEGEEFPDKHAAWREAKATAAHILRSLDLTPARGWRMEIADEFENRLFVLHIRVEHPQV
jgi:hypothetical protein